MSLFGALGSATNSLRLIQSQIQVTSDNVTRSNDPNRTAHRVEQTTNSNGSVTVARFTREIDRALRAQFEGAIAQEAGAQTVRDITREIGDLLGTTRGDPVLSRSVEDFLKAWRDLEATPESPVAEGQVVLLGDQLAREIRRVSQGIEDIAGRIDTEIDTAVDDINRLLEDIDGLNRNITLSSGTNEPITELEDRRDVAVRELSALVSVRVVERSDGRIAVFTPSGLALVDAAANRIGRQEGEIVSSVGNVPVTGHFREGKLGALLSLVADGSQETPPKAAPRDLSAELFRKLRSQLDGIAAAFTGATKPGEPTSFADAYDNAGPTEAGELEAEFFQGTDRFSITLNADLVNGTSRVKQAAMADAAAALGAVGRSFVADGLSARDQDYGGFVNLFLSTAATTASEADIRATSAQEFRQSIETRYQSVVGVNLDVEIAELQVLQRNYAATARVIQAVNTLFDALERIV